MISVSRSTLILNHLRQTGFSLVEMMIALTIGIIITMMLSVVFVNVSKANREQFQAAQQIENARFAMDVISNDLRLAGYYGEFGNLPPPAATLPDPCSAPGAGNVDASTTNNPFAFYVQGYPAASLTARPTVPTACANWIDNASLRPGSDILVVRRLDTVPLINAVATPAVTSATTVTNEVYGQTNHNTLSIQYGTGATIDGTKNATNIATTLTQKDFSQATTGTPPIRPLTAAYIRKVHVDVYFVSNCRSGTGTNGKCTSSDDTIPTLKRLELGPSAGVPTMNLVPLVDGIEFLKIRYGLDTGSTIAGKTVDGTVDSIVTAPATAGDWQNIVTAEIRIVARNTEISNDYTDAKTYDLGSASYTPSGSDVKFHRHATKSNIYIVNIGGRREFTP